MPTFHAAQATWQTGVAATVTPNWPTGYSTALAKDLAVCIVHSGGSAAPTPATPANWTQLATFNGGGGTHGNAAGPRRTTIFTRELTAGAVPSAPAFSSLGASTIMGATIHVIRMDDPSATWDVNAYTAEDTSTGTTVNLTFTTANGEIVSGDLLMGVFSSAQNGTVSGQTLAATGATIGAVTERHDQVNTANPDVKGSSYTASVTAGSNTADATSAITCSATSTGGAILVRFRETGGTSPTLVATSSSGTSDNLSTSDTCPVPSGAASGDIALLAIEVYQGSGEAAITMSWPSGFTEIENEEQRTGANDCQLFVAKKTLTGADSGNYVSTLSASRWHQSQCVLIRGASTVSTPDTNSTKKGSGTSITGTSVTSSGLPVLVQFQMNGSNGSHTPPTNFVERQEADYLTTATQVPGSTGSHSVSGATQSVSTNWIAALFSVEASSGQSATVNKVNETDAATAVTRSKSRTAAQAVETDTAHAVTRSKIKSVAQVTTTETANPITRIKSRTVGQTTETDTARTILVRPIKVPVGQATETDQANTTTRLKTRPAAQATETDAARPINRQKTRNIAQSVETDIAQPIGKARARTVNQAVETDQARAITRVKIKVLGQATETDTARQIQAPFSGVLGKALETDTAHTVTRSKVKAVLQVTETGTARSITPLKTRTIGQVTEADTARSITRLKSKSLGQTVETDTARAVSRSKLATLGKSLETDTARAITRQGVITGTVNKVLETDVAQPITRLKTKAVGRPTETDTARAITKTRSAVIGQASEADTARTITAVKIKQVAKISETDLAQTITRVRIRNIGQVLETDQARVLTNLKIKQVGRAEEIDQALLITFVGQAKGVLVGWFTEPRLVAKFGDSRFTGRFGASRLQGRFKQ